MAIQDKPEVPSVETAYAELLTMIGEAHPHFKIEMRKAILETAVALQNAREMTAASSALRTSVDALTAASNGNTEEMKKWAKKTADWTRALVFVTIALFAAAVAQIVVMVMTAKR